jgi:hypothetical protein
MVLSRENGYNFIKIPKMRLVYFDAKYLCLCRIRYFFKPFRKKRRGKSTLLRLNISRSGIMDFF